MAVFTKYTSGFNVSGTNIGIEAARVQWPAISALTATSASNATSGVMTPDQIQALVSNKVTSVYKVKGTLTAEVTEGVITNMPEDATEGDVYNIKLPEGTSSATIGTEIVLNGDNVVCVVTKEGETEIKSWDKLAASISLDGYATEDWVNTNYSATSAAVANAATSKEDMSDATKTGELAQVGAITGYIDDVFEETRDIIDEITDTTNTASLPDVAAITAYNAKNVTSAFGTVVVTDKTGEGATTSEYVASAKNDKIKFIGGNKVELSTSTDVNGNPTITINNAASAAYYDEETSLIHLF